MGSLHFLAKKVTKEKAPNNKNGEVENVGTRSYVPELLTPKKIVSIKTGME